MTVMTREEFADLTRNYWMVKTNAGVILMFVAPWVWSLAP